jgi:hypothetical protein
MTTRDNLHEVQAAYPDHQSAALARLNANPTQDRESRIDELALLAGLVERQELRDEVAERIEQAGLSGAVVGDRPSDRRAHIDAAVNGRPAH